MRLDLNLATKNYINHRLVNSLIVIMFTVFMMMLYWNASQLISDAHELKRLRTDITGYEKQLNARPAGVSEQEFSRLQTDIRFYNAIIGSKSRDWIGLLDKLESSTPEGISLLSFSTDQKTGEIKLEGKARNFAKVRNYLEKLGSSGNFQDVQLVSHQNSLLSEKTGGIQFNIICKAALK